MRHRPAAFALLLLLAGLVRAQTLSPQPTTSQSERLLFDLTNRSRLASHLPPLAWDPALALAARQHALRMARAGLVPLEHQYPGEPDLTARAAQAGAHFSRVSENLGRATGSDAAAIARLWLQTPVHRANLLSPEHTAVGIAVIEQGGTLFAVQDFSHSAPVLTRAAIEDHIIQLLIDQGLSSAASSDLARSTCQQRTSSAPNARLVVQWDGDTSRLPEALLHQLRSQHFTRAGVGACPTSQTDSAFTAGHVAVLLF